MILMTKTQWGFGAIIFLILIAYVVYEIMKATAVTIQNAEELEEDIFEEEMSSYVNPDKDLEVENNITITHKDDPKGVAVLTEHIASIVKTNPKSVEKLSKEEMRNLGRIKQRYNRKHSKE